MYLLKYEFMKINKSNYFVGSLLVMLLSPIFSLLWMSLNPRGFVLGDFNEMNLIFMGLVGAKTIFPMTGMLLIKIEYDQNGWIGAFVTPLERTKLLIAKLFVAILWSSFLIFYSAVIVIITEVILFNDLNIIPLIFQDNMSYYLLLLYVIPYIIIGMALAFYLEHTVMPLVGFTFVIIIGYFTQLFHENLFLPSAIPKYIISLEWHGALVVAYGILYVCSFIALFFLYRGIHHKDY